MREYIKNKFLKESDKAKLDDESHPDMENPSDSLHHPDGINGERKVTDE